MVLILVNENYNKKYKTVSTYIHFSLGSPKLNLILPKFQVSLA